MKSLLFKYPPSTIYLMPGKDLVLVVGMATGKLLVWESLNNHILKGHEHKGTGKSAFFINCSVTHCLGIKRNIDSVYLITCSTAPVVIEAGKAKMPLSTMMVWDLTPGLEHVHHIRKPVARTQIEGAIKKLAYDELTGMCPVVLC